jgi:hypothetical protein
MLAWRTASATSVTASNACITMRSITCGVLSLAGSRKVFACTHVRTFSSTGVLPSPASIGLVRSLSLLNNCSSRLYPLTLVRYSVYVSAAVTNCSCASPANVSCPRFSTLSELSCASVGRAHLTVSSAMMHFMYATGADMEPFQQ